MLQPQGGPQVGFHCVVGTGRMFCSRRPSTVPIRPSGKIQAESFENRLLVFS